MATSQEEQPKFNIPGYFTVNGLPFSPDKKEILDEVFNFTPGDDDVIIATYPKTGTTWMQYIVLQILSKGESFPPLNDVMEKLVPYLELVGVSAVEALTTRPRVYKHHMPYNKIRKNPNAKIIYTYRKPEDTLVSYFHFTSHYTDLNEYFEKFLTGNICYGPYFDHILSYLENEGDKNLLMVSYEKLLMHREDEILRIAKFLGEEHYIEIANNESVLKKILKQTSFDYMKKNLHFTVKEDHVKDKSTENMPSSPKSVIFFRKGVIGDGKESLSEEQLQQLKKLAEEKLKGTFILREWNENESSL